MGRYCHWWRAFSWLKYGCCFVARFATLFTTGSMWFERTLMSKYMACDIGARITICVKWEYKT